MGQEPAPRKRRIPPESNGHRPSQTRTPPQDLDAEAAILGAATLTHPALEVLATTLRPEDFYSPANGHIAAALIRLYERDAPVDLVTLAAELEREQHLEAAGGRVKLRRLQADTPAAANADYYAGLVREGADLRRILSLANELAQATREPEPWDRIKDLVPKLNGHAIAPAADRSHFADVGAILDGEHSPMEPDLFVRSDGGRLLYAGRMHAFQSAPGHGKSFIALMAVAQVLEAGGTAVVVDYEDTAETAVARLLALGAKPAAVRRGFHHVRPDHPNAAEKAALIAEIRRRNPDLVVIDGVADALSQDGLKEDVAGDVIRWLDSFARPIAAAGAAVLMLDHVMKSKEERGLWARGSGAKLGAVDGVAYYLEADPAWSKTTAGRVKVIVAKDRPGGVGPARSTAALIHVEPGEDGALSWRIDRSLFVDEDGKPTTAPQVADDLVAAILGILERLAGEGGLSTNRIQGQLEALREKGELHFRDKAVGVALALLEQDGRVIRRQGPRRAQIFELPPRQNALDEVLP